MDTRQKCKICRMKMQNVRLKLHILQDIVQRGKICVMLIHGKLDSELKRLGYPDIIRVDCFATYIVFSTTYPGLSTC